MAISKIVRNYIYNLFLYQGFEIKLIFSLDGHLL